MPVDLRDLFYMWKRQTGKAKKQDEKNEMNCCGMSNVLNT